MQYLRNSLFLFLSIFALSAFSSSGECWLTTNADGTYTIVCEGDGVIYDYVQVEEVVYTYGNCESLKDDFSSAISTSLQNLDSLDSSLNSASSYASDLDTYLSNTLHTYNLPDEVINISHNLIFMTEYEIQNSSVRSSSVRDSLNSLSSMVDGINCTSCPTQPGDGSGGGSSGGGSSDGAGSNTCCNVDFTEILSKLDEAEETRKLIKKKVDDSFSVLSQISNSLNTIEFLLRQGFGSTTNELAKMANLLGGFTNLVVSGWSKSVGGNTSNLKIFDYMRRYTLSNPSTIKIAPTSYNFSVAPFSYYADPSHGFQNSFFAQGVISVQALASLNNYFHLLNYYHLPNLTNSVSNFYKSTTNYFSFFRNQIGVSSILSDFNSAQNSQYQDLTYYSYLTNHYIQVSFGGTLSGAQATKTNWFSRIETLLAALVFSDSSKNPSNTVDTSDSEDKSGQYVEILRDVNENAVSSLDNLNSSSESILSLYHEYCNMFEDASLPSRVVVFELSNDDHDIVSFEMSQSGGFSTLVEVCRAVTTFCWASVGIFLLFKFLVWATRCVFVASKFIYLVISKTFK